MKKILLLSALILVFSSYSFAQELDSNATSSPQKFKHQIGVDAKVSTNGFGGDVYWRPLKRVSVKLGYETMSFNYNYNFDNDNIKLDTDLRFKTGAISLTGAYQIIRGIYVTAGIASFQFKPTVKGVPSSNVEMGDITINPEIVGSLSVKIKPQNKISPYAAIGFGNVVPYNKSVAFGFELGAYYMGSPKIEVHSTGMLTPTMDPEHIASLQNEIKQFKFYPVIKFNLSVKLFTFNK